MAGTARTTAYLNNLFRTGQSSGSITSAYILDLIASGANIGAVYNAKSYGAIGDGSSHPASTVYGTLAALQADYGTTLAGVTVALTQEIDWLAHQYAISAAAAANGGVVYTPPGSYYFCNSNSASDGSGTLQFPASIQYTSSGGSVSWRADYRATLMHWPNDLGAGKAAILCGGRTNSSSVGFFEGLCLIGPGVGSTLGSSTSSMAGIMTNDRRSIFRTMVQGFNYGIDVVGGQCQWIDVSVYYCYYDLYWNNPQVDNFGDMVLTKVVCSNASRACVGVHKNATFNDMALHTCAFATSPFCFYKETGGTDNGLITDSVFTQCQFEGFGHALVCDDKTTSTRVAGLYYTKFVNCEINPVDPTSGLYTISGVSTYATWDVASLNSVEIDGIKDPSLAVPSSGGWINVGSINSLRISCDVNALIANCNSASSPHTNQFYTGGAVSTGTELIDDSNWKGGFCFFRATGAVNSVLVASPGNSPGHVVLSAGTTADAPMGILKYNPAPGSAFQNCIYADYGIMTVLCTGTITMGQYVRTASGGVVTAASSATDTTSPIIGIAQAGSSAGSVLVKLRGLR